MKSQAWGWLTAAVLAAGLNSSYHNGGMQWAHEIADQIGHNTGAVLALATGRADQFLAEARMLNTDRSVERPMNTEESKCQFAMTTADLQDSFEQTQDQFESQLDRFQALSDREQARLDRVAAKRVRIENQVRAKLARLHLPEANFTPVMVNVPMVDCPRVRVNIPHAPRVKVLIPEVHVEYSGPGPV